MSGKKNSGNPMAKNKENASPQTAPQSGQAVPATSPEQAALGHAPLTPPAKAARASAPAIRTPGAAPTIRNAPPPAARAVEENLMPGAGGNPYKPHIATIMDVIDETPNIKTLRVILDDADAMRAFTFQAGQVGQLSVFGAGEATFVISSPPSQKEYLQFSVMRAGEVTEAVHGLAPGDKVGVRAPLGRPFPCQEWKGKDIFFVGGGIGMAPIRTVMLHVLEHKDEYGRISLLYGARTPRDMAYSYELDAWLRHPDIHCTLTIDAPFENWEHRVGLIPNVLLELAPSPENHVAVLCGPPVMIKYTVDALKKLNFPDDAIITTLEKRMKCGIGICGRCNIGPLYVCVDGPVFSWARLRDLPLEM